jgi:ribosomal protein S17E
MMENRNFRLTENAACELLRIKAVLQIKKGAIERLTCELEHNKFKIIQMKVFRLFIQHSMFPMTRMSLFVLLNKISNDYKEYIPKDVDEDCQTVSEMIRKDRHEYYIYSKVKPFVDMIVQKYPKHRNWIPGYISYLVNMPIASSE